MGYEGGVLEPLFQPELAEAAVRDMADEGGEWLLERVIANTPVSYHRVALQHQGFKVDRAPGTLKRSWRLRPNTERVRERGATGYSREVYTEDPVAPFVENDTRPHTIRPRHASHLVFRVWPTGRLVRAKVVHHPGTRGAHMVLTAVNAAHVNFDRIVDEPLRRWQLMAARHAMQANRGNGRYL